ncbi:MAG: TdeIII family type II restriction endonuclease [Colwellia sp.]|nr:TdeIII family type II restriction endonuclease [Colwellia sp.]
MPDKKVIKSQLKAKLKAILKIESRVKDKAKDIEVGDVSPFFLSLLGHEITLYGKVAHSITTTFGMSFYEQVCQILSESVGYEVQLQYKMQGEVNGEISEYLDTLLEDNNYKADRVKEIEHIKQLTTPGEAVTNPDSTVDVFVKTPDGVEYYIDITTVKPNKKEFRTLKRKLLKWTAMRLSIDPNADVRAFIAIPYNPEAINDPSCTKYKRFSAFYDRKDILVGNELWNVISNNTFNILDMITVFEDLSSEVTSQLKSELTKHTK